MSVQVRAAMIKEEGRRPPSVAGWKALSQKILQLGEARKAKTRRELNLQAVTEHPTKINKGKVHVRDFTHATEPRELAPVQEKRTESHAWQRPNQLATHDVKNKEGVQTETRAKQLDRPTTAHIQAEKRAESRIAGMKAQHD